MKLTIKYICTPHLTPKSTQEQQAYMYTPACQIGYLFVSVPRKHFTYPTLQDGFHLTSQGFMVIIITESVFWILCLCFLNLDNNY